MNQIVIVFGAFISAHRLDGSWKVLLFSLAWSLVDAASVFRGGLVNTGHSSH